MLREHLAAMPPDARRAAELLVGDVARLRRLVEDLTNLASLDAGREQCGARSRSIWRRSSPGPSGAEDGTERFGSARSPFPSHRIGRASIGSSPTRSATRWITGEEWPSWRCDGPPTAPPSRSPIWDPDRPGSPRACSSIASTGPTHRGQALARLAIARENARLLGETSRRGARSVPGRASRCDSPRILLPNRDTRGVPVLRAHVSIGRVADLRRHT